MKNTNGDIEIPALGCKIGRAYFILLSQLANTLNEAGLEITTSEYLVLRAVYSKEGIQHCEIAELVGKDKAAVCRCVATLEKKGFIVTESVSHKCLKVYPTEYACKIEPRIMEVAERRHQALAALSSPENLKIFTDILDKIIMTS